MKFAISLFGAGNSRAHGPGRRATPKGFTIVELLVVITIIVLLMALLTPALDKAVYQAELLQCAGLVRALGGAATIYAAEHARRYPTRFIDASKQPHFLVKDAGVPATDERLALRPYIPMKTFQDPFTPKLDYDNLPAGVDAYTPYKLWYSWAWGTQPGQTRIGDRFSWTSTTTGTMNSFNVLAGDYVEHYDAQTLLGNHQDREGMMLPQILDNTITPWATNERATYARWHGDTTTHTFDPNFAFQDGSVAALRDLPSDDTDRTVRVPEYAGSSDDVVWYTLLPAVQ